MLALKPGSSQPYRVWGRELGWWSVWTEGRGGPQLPLHVLLTAPLQVEQALDTGVLGQLDGPGGLVLSALRHPSGSLSPLKGRAVLCLLGALVGKRTPGGGVGGLRRTLSGLGSRCVLP